MAALNFVSVTADVPLSASTALTVLQVVAPTNQRVKVLGWGVTFDATEVTILATPVDTSSLEAVKCELLVGSTSAGTMTHVLGDLGTYGSKHVSNGCSATIQSVASSVASAEPIYTGILDAQNVPQTESYTIMFEEGSEPIINGDFYIGIRCTSQDVVNCRAKLICEE